MMKTTFESQAPCVSCLAVNNNHGCWFFHLLRPVASRGSQNQGQCSLPFPQGLPISSSRINGNDEELARDANLLTKWSANCNRILGGCKFTGGEFGQERIAYDLQLLIKAIVLTMLVEHSSSQVICLLSLGCMTQFQTVWPISKTVSRGASMACWGTVRRFSTKIPIWVRILVGFKSPGMINKNSCWISLLTSTLLHF